VVFSWQNAPLAIVFTLDPGKSVINLGQRLNRYLGRSSDEPWTPFAV
jgi:hypothetical protein